MTLKDLLEKIIFSYEDDLIICDDVNHTDLVRIQVVGRMTQDIRSGKFDSRLDKYLDRPVISLYSRSKFLSFDPTMNCYSEYMIHVG